MLSFMGQRERVGDEPHVLRSAPVPPPEIHPSLLGRYLTRSERLFRRWNLIVKSEMVKKCNHDLCVFNSSCKTGNCSTLSSALSAPPADCGSNKLSEAEDHCIWFCGVSCSCPMFRHHTSIFRIFTLFHILILQHGRKGALGTSA